MQGNFSFSSHISERVRHSSSLQEFGYSCRQITGSLHVAPQAVLLVFTRHRRSLKSLRGAMDLLSLWARAVIVLGRYSIRVRAQARQSELLERLAREHICGRKAVDAMARWVEKENNGASEGALDMTS